MIKKIKQYLLEAIEDIFYSFGYLLHQLGEFLLFLLDFILLLFPLIVIASLVALWFYIDPINKAKIKAADSAAHIVPQLNFNLECSKNLITCKPLHLEQEKKN